MAEPTPTYSINLELRDSIEQKLGILLKENVSLQQSIREQKNQAIAQNEDLFLELLEVADALEALLNYLENNSDPSPEFIASLPKSISIVNRKFLSLLKKRQVLPIELESKEPDFNLCRVVDQEERSDVGDQTITKVVRKGFYWGEKILRPVEVITAILPKNRDDINL
ncbi:nucleotide exchange factor GrpE [Cronbergia sp. UHCC 0137]|uniref:nucleotide exchange factor GrpE n=1 Tax=Cronbergia sp. UHCC 0137 TaxID=3110239 RepID=UPI002B1F436F|nr:nucleotide exchange factor GrpE [Cronbergia sp. UHCC 0137]MEA5620751.1 nucleotide exchange factor GrpE [Cronbergia sp. UHCC 0137]